MTIRKTAMLSALAFIALPPAAQAINYTFSASKAPKGATGLEVTFSGVLDPKSLTAVTPPKGDQDFNGSKANKVVDALPAQADGATVTFTFDSNVKDLKFRSGTWTFLAGGVDKLAPANADLKVTGGKEALLLGCAGLLGLVQRRSY